MRGEGAGEDAGEVGYQQPVQQSGHALRGPAATRSRARGPCREAQDSPRIRRRISSCCLRARSLAVSFRAAAGAGAAGAAGGRRRGFSTGAPPSTSGTPLSSAVQGAGGRPAGPVQLHDAHRLHVPLLQELAHAGHGLGRDLGEGHEGRLAALQLDVHQGPAADQARDHAVHDHARAEHGQAPPGELGRRMVGGHGGRGVASLHGHRPLVPGRRPAGRR